MRVDTAAVMRAALAWSYAPPGCPEVRTEDFLLVARPAAWDHPTVVSRIDSARSAAEVIEEIMAAAAGLGRTQVTFWTHPGTRPADLVAHLLAQGAVPDEQMAVLARPLLDPAGRPDLPDLAVPADVQVRPALDLGVLRDHDRVGAAVFGGATGTDADLLAGHHDDLTRGVGFVAYRDDLAVAAAGLTVRDGAARLWGGATLPTARRTGAYRALLACRLQVGADLDAPMALVKARVATSAPILRRAGFAQHGEERSYLLGRPDRPGRPGGAG